MPHKHETASLGALAGVRDGILHDISPLPIDADGGALEGELHGIAVHLLKQTTAGAESDVVGGPASRFGGRKDRSERVPIDAVTLDDSHVRVEDLESLGVGGKAKPGAEQVQDLHDDGRGIAAIRPNHEYTVTREHLLAQLAAPQLFAGVEDVVGVGDDGDEPGRKCSEHIPEGIHLMLTTPRGDRRVLGGRNREPRHRRAVEALEHHEGRNGIGAHEVQEVRRTAESGGLH